MKKKEKVLNAQLKEQKRNQIEVDLTSSTNHAAIVEMAVYLLAGDMTHACYLTPETQGFDSVVQLLNPPMLEDVLEERNAKSMCANLRCQNNVKAGATPLMDILAKLKKNEPEVKEGIKSSHCCSDKCRKIADLIVKQVASENQSTIQSLTQASHFHNAAELLRKYSKEYLKPEIMLQKKEIQRVEKLLDSYDYDQLKIKEIIRPVTEKIVETPKGVLKQPEKAPEPVLQEETKIQPPTTQEEQKLKPLARANFPITVKNQAPRLKVEEGQAKPNKKGVSFTEDTKTEEEQKETKEKDDDQDSSSQCESEATSGDGDFEFGDVKAEIAGFETDMSQFVKLNILFTDIATREFALAVSGENLAEQQSFPSSTAKDFFQNHLDEKVFTIEGQEGKTHKTTFSRLVTQLVQTLDIRRVNIPLKSKDWKTISRIFFSLMSSPRGPLFRKFPDLAKEIHESIGELQGEEVILSSFLLSAAQRELQ